MTHISVIVPSYNHEAFVVDAVHSVLRQTVRPTEVIVVDDCSQDGSVARLRRIADERVRIIVHKANMGGAATLNTGIRSATGEYIAICNSDDLWEVDKLEKQLRAFETHPELGAVFTDVRWVGEHGQREKGYGDIFRQANRSRFEWTKRLLEGGNCLCHPSVMIRAAVYSAVGEYDNRFRQLPDYRMWLRVVNQFEIEVLDEPLIRFRLHGNNTSQPSPSTSARDRNECALIWEETFLAMDANTLHGAFGTRRHPSDPQFNLAVEKVFYLWSVSGYLASIARTVANEIAFRLIGTEAGVAAWESYGLTVHDFHTLHGIGSPWLRPPAECTTPAETDLMRRIGGYVPPRPSGSPASATQGSPLEIKKLTGMRKLRRELRRIRRQVTNIFSGTVA
ncbi:MAG: glycosyltransferase [Rhizobiales bacterium]|nr:glycosyltransferase [Hyphomicrobiales bacterium]